MRFSRPDFHGLTSLIRTTHHGRVWSWTFSSIITFEFPSHFILSLIDVYRDTVTRDKLTFPSAITWIIHHFSISYPELDHFFIMGAIGTATVRRCDAQLCPRRTQTEMAAPLASSAPSIPVPSSSVGGVTIDAIMA